MIDDPEGLIERIAELEIEVQQLKHELRRYEPSDAVMIQLLGLNETIREAARLLADVQYEQGCASEPAITAWLALPVVQRARKFVRGE